MTMKSKAAKVLTFDSPCNYGIIHGLASYVIMYVHMSICWTKSNLLHELHMTMSQLVLQLKVTWSRSHGLDQQIFY